jgi:hypothetical protein
MSPCSGDVSKKPQAEDSRYFHGAIRHRRISSHWSHDHRTSTRRPATAKIQRSDAARHSFARQTGYPNGRSGYGIDHVVPLACGGADAPSNMA